MPSLYIHVPFCVVKCGYCDFNSYVVDDETVHDRFLTALQDELRLAWPGGTPSSAFFGGGTPSLLSPDRLQRLFEAVDAVVPLAQCAEVSMEANPESMTAEKAAIARGHGVTRMSLGVQSFHPHHLRFLDRAHTAERAEEAFAEVRSAGFDNVSVDLMFGIPHESDSEWASDLDRALALMPDHMSCYSLTFEPGTQLTHRLERGEVTANDEETDRNMFLHTRRRLAEAGFVAYEISNFAGRGGACRHNDHYWQQGDYVGVGPGASSHSRGVRWTNLKPIDAWTTAALSGVSCAATAETLRPRQRAGEALWLGIRRRDGVDLPAVEERVGLPVREMFHDEITKQVERGLVEYDGEQLRLTDAGLLLGDRVGSDLLAAGL